MTQCLLCGAKNLESITLPETLDRITLNEYSVVCKKHRCSHGFGSVVEIYRKDKKLQTLPHTYRDYPAVHVVNAKCFVVSVNNENYLYKNNRLTLIYPGFEIHNVFDLDTTVVLFGKLEDSNRSKLTAFKLTNLNNPIFDKVFDDTYSWFKSDGNVQTFVCARPSALAGRILSDEPESVIYNLIKTENVKLSKRYVHFNLSDVLDDSPFGTLNKRGQEHG